MRKYIMLFSLLCCGTVYAALPQAQWQKVSIMPAPRSNPVVVTYHNYIYVAGGNDMHGATNTFWRFNPRTNNWHTLPAMQQKRFAHSGIIWHHRLYIFGGMSAPNHYLNSVEYYNFNDQSWHTAGTIPYANARFALVKYQGRILMLGGLNTKHSAITKILSYNPKTAAWHNFARLPKALNRLSAVNMHGHLHIMGGADKTGAAQDGVWELRRSSRQWLKRHSLQNPRQNFALTLLKHHLILTGGWRQLNGQTVYVASTEQFTRHKKTSKIIGYLPQGRDGVRMVTLHNQVYLFGGYNKIISNLVQKLVIQKPTISPLIKEINHACIITPNMQRTINFYHNLLGFEIIKDNYESNAIISKELSLPNVQLRNVFLRAPGGFELQVIQFFHPRENSARYKTMTTIGYNHIGMEVTNIKQMYHYLQQHNVKIIAPPIVKTSSAFAIFFAEDPDGNHIEFFQRLKH